MKDLVVLSLFDGMGGRIALDKLGITPKKYFASEIKKHAIKCATTNYHDIIEIGDVTNFKKY
jgi:site-specific DNA-cytosine methylase